MIQTSFLGIFGGGCCCFILIIAAAFVIYKKVAGKKGQDTNTPPN